VVLLEDRWVLAVKILQYLLIFPDLYLFLPLNPKNPPNLPHFNPQPDPYQQTKKKLSILA
jgi:hypothetical protein